MGSPFTPSRALRSQEHRPFALRVLSPSVSLCVGRKRRKVAAVVKTAHGGPHSISPAPLAPPEPQELGHSSNRQKAAPSSTFLETNLCTTDYFVGINV